MDMRLLVGRNLRRARKAKGLTQEQLSERTGVAQQHLSELERGNGNPTVVTLYELAQVLDVTVVMLVSPDGDVDGAEPIPVPD
jgi:transcriptional regulator with XRE-family HTH domain